MAATLLLAGATGLVGGHLLELALDDVRVERVVSIARRPQPAAERLQTVVVDFENLPDLETIWRADVAVCALGTTLKTAGSREAFRRVDHDMVLAFATHARRHGVASFGLVSAMGADSRSWFFYNRVKGDAEAAVSALDFPSLTVARPGLIGGTRGESRPAEALARSVVTALAPVLPQRFRINPGRHIARVLLDHVLAASPGTTFVSSAEMT
jgi:uncharacterized protein YbjT (DUF2867 family)